jgi:hypothetical protein
MRAGCRVASVKAALRLRVLPLGLNDSRWIPVGAQVSQHKNNCSQKVNKCLFLEPELHGEDCDACETGTITVHEFLHAEHGSRSSQVLVALGEHANMAHFQNKFPSQYLGS